MGDNKTDFLDDHTVDLKGSKGQGEGPRVLVPSTQSEDGSHGSDDGLASLKEAAIEGDEIKCTMGKKGCFKRVRTIRK